MITVATEIAKPISLVWQCFTAPEHIMQWNNASPDWFCPRATNNLQSGGNFAYRMEAKDGKFGFDFEGIYDAVIPKQLISYHLEDGRAITVTFETTPTGTLVTEKFDPEEVNSLDMQKSGWQAILNNFKSHTELQG